MEVESDQQPINNQLNQLVHKDQKNNGNKEQMARVKVAVRLRPFIDREYQEQQNQNVVNINKSRNEIKMGDKNMFTFDHVFGIESTQTEIYQEIVQDLVEKCFEGYNSTILAYGQTGSGKTFTMGTSSLYVQGGDENAGIIQRVISDIFKKVNQEDSKQEYILKCSYYEIYKDSIIDLLDPNPQMIGKEKDNVVIRQEADGQICIYGLYEEVVKSNEDMIDLLEKGGLKRSTSCTLMNATSSRSHAIFTIYIEQHDLEDIYDQKNDQTETENKEGAKSTGFTNSKFHFVDLAGSERAKKTGATGATLKEGININMGLLSLGNVIQSLTENAQKKRHIPYRDSKLTRILQDSLGGNSNTVMIACLSPAFSNFDETLNTLKYASRARKIKNKPVINRDPNSVLIQSLKQQNHELQMDLQKVKQVLIKNNISLADIKFETVQALEGNPFQSPQKMKIENEGQQTLLSTYKNNNFANDNYEDQIKIKNLSKENVNLKKENLRLTSELQILNKQKNDDQIQFYQNQKEKEEIQIKFEKANSILQQNNINVEYGDEGDQQYINLVNQYSKIIEQQKQELNEEKIKFKEMQSEYKAMLETDKKHYQILSQKQKTISDLSKKNKTLESDLLNLSQQSQNFLSLSGLSNQANNQLQSSKLMTQKQQKSSFIRQNINSNQDQNNLMEEENSSYIDEENQMTTTANEEDQEDSDDSTEEILDYDQIMKDQEIQKAASILKETSEQVESRINHIKQNIQIKKKQIQLETDQQIEAQNKLLKELKEQHHSKIQQGQQKVKELEFSLSKLQGKQGNHQDQTKINEFVSKIKKLQDDIKILKQKEGKQNQLKQDVHHKDERIRTLQDDLKSFKKEKQLLNKQIKISTEDFEKFKQQKIKDLRLQQKKINKKDQQIKTLQSKNQRQLRVLEKQKLENKQLKKGNDYLQKVINPKSYNLKISKRNTVQSLIEPDQLDPILRSYLKKLLIYQETELKIQKQGEQIQVVESQRDELNDNLINIQLQIDKIQIDLEAHMQDDSDDIFFLQDKIKDLQNQEENIQSDIDSLDQKIVCLDQQIQKMQKRQQLKTYSQIQEELIKKISKFNHNLIYKSIFDILMENYQELARNIEKISDLKLNKLDQETQILSLKNQIDINDDYYKREIENLKRELYNNKEVDDSQDDIENQQHFMAPTENFKHKHSPRKQKNQNDIEKKNNKLQKELNELKIKYEKQAKKQEILQSKYDGQKKDNKKDSFIGVQGGHSLNSSMNINHFQQDQQYNQFMQNQNQPSNQLEKIFSQDSNSTNNSQKINQNINQKSGLNSFMSYKERRKQMELNNNNQNYNSFDIQSKFEKLDQSLKLNNNHSHLNNKFQKPEKKTMHKTSFAGGTRNQSPMLRHVEKTRSFSSSNNSNLKENQDFLLENVDQFQSYYNWDVAVTIPEAHTGQIYSVQSHGNILYSTSSKSLKIWDLETNQQISEINAHSGMIKCSAIWKSQNVIVTACSNIIKLWDMTSLTQVNTFKTNIEIKALHVYDDLLFSGGKGDKNSNSLLIWDGQSTQPIEQGEKNQEILSIQGFKNTIYCGCRNHSIRRMLYEEGKLSHLPSLEPPHLDLVNSIAIVDEYIASGSKDKSIKLWDVQNQQNVEHINTAYTPLEISVVKANPSSKILYSGFRDGRIKVFNVNNQKLGCISDIANTGQQGINSICNIYNGEGYNGYFATGSQDKSIRLFKPTEETKLNLQNLEQNFSDSQIQDQEQNQSESQFQSQQTNKNNNQAFNNIGDFNINNNYTYLNNNNNHLNNNFQNFNNSSISAGNKNSQIIENEEIDEFNNFNNVLQLKGQKSQSVDQNFMELENKY